MNDRIKTTSVFKNNQSSLTWTPEVKSELTKHKTVKIWTVKVIEEVKEVAGFEFRGSLEGLVI